MSDSTSHDHTGSQNTPVGNSKLEAPSILVAHAPLGSCAIDRCRITDSFTVGRGDDNDLVITDDRISNHHFRIIKINDDFWVEDLMSTNRTFLNGFSMNDQKQLSSPSVIRAGWAVFVFHEDGGPLLDPPPSQMFNLVGPFHMGPLIKKLKDAAVSNRSLLLIGPIDSGKKKAAQAIISMMEKQDGPVSHTTCNANHFNSDKEAAAALLGDDSNPGLIERAAGGVLVINEAHALPQTVLASIEKMLQDNTIGTRLLFLTQASTPSVFIQKSLLARLLIVRVPPLNGRVADVPSIFDNLLRQRLRKSVLNEQEVMPLLSGELYEALCLDGFKSQNLFGLTDLVNRLTDKMETGDKLSDSINAVFAEQFSDGTAVRRHISLDKDRNAPDGA